MGKKGKRNKTTNNQGKANLQAYKNFGKSSSSEYTAVKDAAFINYLQKLRERHSRGGSQENAYYIQACDLTNEALNLGKRKLFAQSANLLSNAWLTNYRATQAMMYHHIHILAADSTIKQPMRHFFELLQSIAASEQTMSATKCNLSYMLLNFVPGTPPEDLIKCLDGALQCVQKPNNPNAKTDVASLLMQKSVQFMKVGREKYALKCLNKAAKVARGEVEGNSALFMSLCLRKVGILPSNSLENLTKNIRDLRWLLKKVHVENREYYEIPIRLSNLLMCCGEGAARKEAIALQKQHDELLVSLRKLHSPHEEVFASDARKVSTAMMAGAVEHANAGIVFKPVQFNVPSSVASGSSSSNKIDASPVKELNSGNQVCMNCGVSKVKLLKCSGCKTIQYCTKKCQIAHWKSHKPSCKELRAARNRGVAKVPKMSQKEKSAKKTKKEKHRSKLGLPGDSRFEEKPGNISSIQTQRKWIQSSVQDPNFVQWFMNLNFDKRQEYMVYFVPDMAKKWKNEKDGLFPGLAVDYLCGNQCDCLNNGGVEKAAANHGAASGLLCQMWKLNSMSLKESFEQDLMNAGILSVAGKFHFNSQMETVVVKRENEKEDQYFILKEPGNMSNEPGPDGRSMNDIINDPRDLRFNWRFVVAAATTKRKIWHGVMLGVVDMYHEMHIQEATPNLMLRSQGCSVCSKELPLYYVGGVNLNCPFSDVGVESRCFVCKGEHWCSDECRSKQNPPHNCMGTECINRALRSTMPDKQNTGGTM